MDYLYVAFGGPGAGYEVNDGTRIDDGPGFFPNAKVVGGYDFAGDDYTGDERAHRCDRDGHRSVDISD